MKEQAASIFADMNMNRRGVAIEQARSANQNKLEQDGEVESKSNDTLVLQSADEDDAQS